MSRTTLYLIIIIIIILYGVFIPVHGDGEKNYDAQNKVTIDTKNGSATNNTTINTGAKVDDFKIVTLIVGYVASIILVLYTNFFLWKKKYTTNDGKRKYLMTCAQGVHMSTNLLIQLLSFIFDIGEYGENNKITAEVLKQTCKFLSMAEFYSGSLLMALMFYETSCTSEIRPGSLLIVKLLDKGVRALLRESVLWMVAPVILTLFRDYIFYFAIVANSILLLLGLFYPNSSPKLKKVAVFLFKLRISFFATMHIIYSLEMESKTNQGLMPAFLKLVEVTRGLIVFCMYQQDTIASQKETINTLINYLIYPILNE